MLARLFTAAAMVLALTAPAHAQLSKDVKLLAPFKPVVAKASESTVRVLCDDKDTILGTVVDPEGYILTKWSELKGNLIVRTSDSNEYDATLVAAHRGTDLALLKVDAKNLKAVEFADTRKVPAGNWVVASGVTSDPVAVGIVSVMTRKTTGRDARIPNPKAGYLGIMSADEKDKSGNLIGAKIDALMPGGPAFSAGLAAGDVICEVNGKKIEDMKALLEVLDGLSGGETVAVKAQRKGETKDFKVTLGTRPKESDDRSTRMNNQGSVLSGRRAGFAEVLQTDMVLDAKDCGGPVLDLDGNVLGINIARAGRVETWVLPSEVIKPLLPDLKAGKFPPPAIAPAPRLKGK
jgi:serine protease Do